MIARHRQVALVSLMLLAAVAVIKCTVFPGRAFEAELWRESVRNSRYRGSMADRLVARAALIGLTTDEIIAMLGEPEPRGQIRNWDLVYYLCPARALLSCDSEWLVARVGLDKRVTEARIVRD